MLVEVIGIGAPNKGAELMLIAIKQQILQKYPNAKFVVEPGTDFLDRCSHKVYQKIWHRSHGIQWGIFGSLIPKKIRKKFGLVTDSEIDVILDASGFAYGDQWKPGKLEKRLIKYLPRWKRQNKKIILLPQALGPFEIQKFNSLIPILYEGCDLIYARDKQSYKYITEKQSDTKNKIKLSPDFTNLCEGTLPFELVDKELDICFIPNSKMREMTSKDVGSNYAQSFSNLIKVAQDNGRKPFLLLHEGEKDLNLANEINNLLENKVELLTYDNPLHIKGIIGKSNITVSSRFHGLVSSLSQGKPCIATGWSHKYGMLMEDYGCSEFYVDQSSNDAIEKTDIFIR